MLEQELDIAKINAWANGKFRDSLRESFDDLKLISTPYGSFQDLVYHIYVVSYYWLSRIGCADYELKTLSEIKSKEELFKQWELADIKLVNFMDKMVDEGKSPDHKFKYKTSKGIESEISLRLILSQINNHSYYHRGQLAYIVKINGKPGLPQTDSLVYYREQ